MPNPTMSVVSGSYKLALTPTPDVQTRILQTQNKFVDKNIVVEVAGATAASTPSLHVTTNTATVTVGTASGGKYPVSANITGNTTYGTAGWITTDGLGAVTDTNVQIGTIAQSTLSNGSTAIASGATITPNATATQTINISAGYEGARTVVVAAMSSGQSATATVSASGAATSPTVAHEASAQDGKTQITVTPVTATSGISKYFIAVKATAPATTLTPTKTVNRVGYLGTSDQINASAGTTTSTRLYYIPLDTAAVTISANGSASTPTAVSNSSTTVSSKTNLGLSSVSSTSSINTPYFVAIDLTAPATNISSFTKTVNTNGYIDNTDQISVSGSLNASSATYYIPIGQGALSAGNGSTTATSSNITLASVTATQPASGAYYITITGSGKVGVGTAGWLTTATTQKDSNTATAYIKLNTASTTHNAANNYAFVSEGYVPEGGINIPLGTGSISASSTAPGTGWTANDTSVPSQGYLKIAAGYYPNTYLSLDSILGGEADTASTTVDHILKGYAAYDVDGKLLTGTIDTYTGEYTES